MKKTELEKLNVRLVRELSAQRRHYEKLLRERDCRLQEQAAARCTAESWEEEDEVPPPPKRENPTRPEQLREWLKDIPTAKFGDTPRFEEYVEQYEPEGLRNVSAYLFIALLKRDAGENIAQMYMARTLPRFAFSRIVRVYNRAAAEDALNITDDLRAAAEEIRREIETKACLLAPTAGKFRLRGRAELELFLNEHVVDLVNNHAVYRALGIDFPQPFILEGTPGCGKTFAVERLAEHLGWNLVRITSDSIGSSLVHGTAKKIEEAFAEAVHKAPTLMVIDEMDAFMPNRAAVSEHNTHSKEEVGCFLKLIQTAAEKHVLVVGMTNLLQSIDPAILRTGRMGTHIKVDMPSLTEVEDVLRYALEKRPHEDFALTPYAEQLLNRPLSDVTCAADEAAMHAARERRTTLTEADLAAALQRLQQRSAPKEERRPIGFAA